MEQNIINEAIVLIASLMSLVVLQRVQRSLDAFIATSTAAAFAAAVTVILFAVSASPIGLSIVIIAFSIGSIRYRRNEVVASSLLTFMIGSWVIMIIRFLSGEAGFKLGLSTGNIAFMAAFIVAVLTTLFAFTRVKSTGQKANNEKEEAEDDGQTLWQKAVGAVRANPAASYCIAATALALVIFGMYLSK